MKTRYTFLISLCLFLFNYPAYAISKHCNANSDEFDAMRIRALQTELMVGAIACSHETSYNDFMKKFKPALRSSHDRLSTFFYKQNPTNGEHHLNQFITTLANAASAESLKIDETAYCEANASLFKKVLKHDPKRLDSFVRDQKNLDQVGELVGCK